MAERRIRFSSRSSSSNTRMGRLAAMLTTSPLLPSVMQGSDCTCRAARPELLISRAAARHPPKPPALGRFRSTEALHCWPRRQAHSSPPGELMSENQNRRGFLGTAAAALAATIGWPLKPYAQGNAEGDTGRPTDADLIVTNAKVYTVDAKLPRAEAFAIKNGRFVAVGTSSDISGLRGRNTQLIDAAQMTVTPGFIDCHNHAPGDTLLYDVIVGNPYEVEFVTIQSIIDKLRERAMKTPPGYWVVGEFFDDTKVKDKRELNIHDLDQVSNQHPVEVHHRGGHTSFYRSEAFELAGVTRSAANPAGGTFDRDPNGELNGRVTDRAN